MKVAIVHDWLVAPGGAEKVLEDLLALYPEADLFSMVDFLPAEHRDFLGGRSARTSFIQRLPGSRTRYRAYLPLMPLAVEQFDLTSYDLVLTSSYAVAKGVITGPDQLHVCYIHSPMRYAWDLQHQYLRESRLQHGPRGWLVRALLHYMRLWDGLSSNRVDHFIANSSFVARRVQKVYRRDARVIHPPVDLKAFSLQTRKDDVYVTASRLVPYKRIDAIVEAFSRLPDRRLIVVGDGPERSKIEKLAGANVELLGYRPFEELRRHMMRAKAFVFAAEEDFGIVPVEAQACGTPVIAFGKGGARETVRSIDDASGAPPTGIFFDQQTPESIAAAVERFESEQSAFSAELVRRHAETFRRERFREEFHRTIIELWDDFDRARRVVV